MNDSAIVKPEYKKGKILWISPLAAGVILTLIFKTSHRFPGENHIFLVADYYIQFVDYILMFWRKLFSGNGLFYSFDLGMGAATWEHYAFYGFSPFNLAFVFIKDADTAAFCLLLLKVCAIALSMHLFLVYGMRVREIIAVLFSVPYALCGFVLCFYPCIIFMDYLYILPIVMLMMIRLFRTGKAGGLTAAYAYSFLTAYYGGYMIGIFSFVCFLIMLVNGEYGESRKKLIARYIIGVMVAALISAVVTVPSGVAILAGLGGESSGQKELGVHLYSFVSAMYPFTYIDVYTIQPAIYCGLVTLISVIGYFVDKTYGIKERMTVALPIVFLMVCVFFKPAHLMMHGFDEPDGYYFRFAYIISFYFSAVGARWIDGRGEKVNKLPFILMWLLLIILVIKNILLPGKELDEQNYMTGAVITFFALFYYFSLSKCRYIFACGLLLLELFMNGYYCNTPDDPALDRWRESYELLNRQGGQALSEIAHIEAADNENQFYRVNYRYGLDANDSMYFGYHGIGYFSSMEQKDLRRALKRLGYATAARVVREKGGSPFTEMIFAQKYKVSADPVITDPESETVVVEKNKNVLPIAFAVSEQIKEYDANSNAFENQQKLLNTMLGHEQGIWENYEGDVSLEYDNSALERMEDNSFRVIRTAPGSALTTLAVDSDENDDYYSYLAKGNNGLRDEAPVVYSDAENEIVGQTNYSNLSMPATIKLGSNDGKSSLYIRIDEDGDESGFFDTVFIANFNNKGLDDAYEELSPGGLKISRMKDNDICGHISIPEDKKILFTSIPYDKYWHITADGERVETFSVLDGAFLACRLTEGEHEIRIYYENKTIKYGACISVIGIVLLIGIILSDNKRRTIMTIKNEAGNDD